jgi:hypothetical protein
LTLKILEELKDSVNRLHQQDLQTSVKRLYEEEESERPSSDRNARPSNQEPNKCPRYEQNQARERQFESSRMKSFKRNDCAECFRCHKKGHRAIDCYANLDRTRPRMERSDSNRNTNHFAKKCITGECYWCGSKDHSGVDCEEKRKRENELGIEIRCTAKATKATGVPKLESHDSMQRL